MRFATGSSMSIVVAPPGVARLKRTPRTRAASSRLSSSSVTLALTTATPRAVGAAFGERLDETVIKDAVGRGLHDHVARGADPLLQHR